MNPAQLLRFAGNLSGKRQHMTLLWRHLHGKRGAILPDDDHLLAALAWLQAAYRQSDRAGIAGFYSLLEGWYDAYPETTGYIIESLLNYYKESRQDEYLEWALKLADWEIEIQREDGSIRGFCIPRGLSDIPIVFDTAQVIFGWSALYRTTKIPGYLSAAEKAAVWLMNNQNPEGIWERHVYKGHCGTYNSRAAWAMLLSARDTGREDLAKGAVRFLRWVISKQTPSGFFSMMGYQARKQVFTHAIGYTLEGLIGSADELSSADAAFSDELRRSFLMASSRLLEEFESTGTLYGEYKEGFKPVDRGFLCVTGTAQIAGCFLKAFSLTNDSRYFQAASSLIDEVKSIQNLWADDPMIYGSFPGSFPIWKRYQRWRLVTWAAKFFVDALLEKRRLQNIHPLLAVREADPSTNLPAHSSKKRVAAGIP